MEQVIIDVISEYGKPIELSKLMHLVRERFSLRKVLQTEVKEILINSELFFCVDAFNQVTSKIWALQEWPALLRSLFSYKDWSQHEPRIGKVVLEMYEIISKHSNIEGIPLEYIREHLTGIRHHIQILREVIDYDPLFEIDHMNMVHLSIDGIKNNIFCSNDSSDQLRYFQNVVENFVKPPSLNILVEMILERYPLYYSIDELTLAASLFDVKLSVLLMEINSTKSSQRIAEKVYVTKKIDSWSFFKEIQKKYNLNISDINSYIMGVFEEAEGWIELAKSKLPFSEEILLKLLCNHDQLVMVTLNCWLPQKFVPDPLRYLSEYRLKLMQNIEYHILDTLKDQGKPLELKQIIFKALGLMTPSDPLIRLFQFWVVLLVQEGLIYQIPNTDYLSLRIWEDHLPQKIMQIIVEWLDEEKGFSDFTDIQCKVNLTGYEIPIEELRLALEMWPEVIKTVDGLYGTCSTAISLETEATIKSYIMNMLSEYPDGMNMNELNVKVNDLLHYDQKVTNRQFKNILKQWGHVAIVRPKVYLMEQAPVKRMRVGDIAYCIIKEFEEPVPYSLFEDEIRLRNGYDKAFSTVLLVEPKIMRPSRGYYALREWGLEEFNPEIFKQLSETLIGIIENYGRPVHKFEIQRELRRKGMMINEGTLHLNISEESHIEQVARGVYGLKKWELQFKDLYKYNFPFRLSLPNGEQKIIEVRAGTVIQYMVTKNCLDTGRILIRRYMIDYFRDLQPLLRFKIIDRDGDPYMSWVEKVDETRWQLLGIKRWYKIFRPRYGDSIYLFLNKDKTNEITLYTAKDAETLFGI